VATHAALKSVRQELLTVMLSMQMAPATVLPLVEVVEVTHRSARRLFGLAGMAPVRDVTAPPRRPEPGRGRGRPRLGSADEAAAAAQPPAPLPPVSRFERPAIDYAALEAAMAHREAVIRSTRQTLDLQAKGSPVEPVGDAVRGGKS
jgi:hypothetical protein